uniref:Secretoglobin family 1C member 1 n=1 Tax=Phasianus colchicus TaxID=9054 RepID=A0A669PMY6_PHACC
GKGDQTVRAALFVIFPFVFHTPGAGSSHEVVPSLLQTLLEGSVEQLYAGPISRYNVDETTSAALTELKKCIDELSPEHLKALVNLLVLDKEHPSILT